MRPSGYGESAYRCSQAMDIGQRSDQRRKATCNMSAVASECLPHLTHLPQTLLPNWRRSGNLSQHRRPLTWHDARHLLPAGHAINAYQHLMTRVDPKQIEAMVEANKESLQPVHPQARIPKRAMPSTSSTQAKMQARYRRNHLHRRLQQGRPAHRANRQRRACGRRRKTAAADAGYRRRKNP